MKMRTNVKDLVDSVSMYNTAMLEFYMRHPEFTRDDYFDFCSMRWHASETALKRWLREDVRKGIVKRVTWGKYRVPDKVLDVIKEVYERRRN